MGIIDVVIIVIVILGIFIGWQRGLIKEIADLLALFVSMLLSGLLKGPITNLLYGLLPFLSYGGKANGLYTINLILYQVITYLLLLMLFLGIYQLVMRKLKLNDKIKETMVETNITFSILGAVVGAPLIIMFLYNVMLFVKLPLFNVEMINSSKYTKLILEKTPVVSKVNESLYLVNEYVITNMNDEKNKDLSREYMDDKIASYMIKKDFIKKDKLNKLVNEGLIHEYKPQVDDENKEE